MSTTLIANLIRRSPRELAFHTADLPTNVQIAIGQAVDQCLVSATPLSSPRAPHSITWNGSWITVDCGEDALHPVLTLETKDITLSAFQRRIPLHGLSNLRDTGGYHTEAGPMPLGKVYRSENLSKLTADDWILLKNLEINTIIDLRTPAEKEHAPSQVPKGLNFDIIEIPMFGLLRGYDDAFEAVAQGAITAIDIEDMVKMYADLLAQFSNSVREASEILGRSDRLPALVHCTAGKDRTGLVVALHQLSAGVGTSDIFEDYLLSNLYRTPTRLRELGPALKQWGVNPIAVRPYLGAPYEALASAMPHLVALVNQSQ